MLNVNVLLQVVARRCVNQALKAHLQQAKSDGKKSNMAIAIEIEMAIHQAEEFEKQLQMLFFQSNKMDVWNKIKARSHALDADAAHKARKVKVS